MMYFRSPSEVGKCISTMKNNKPMCLNPFPVKTGPSFCGRVKDFVDTSSASYFIMLTFSLIFPVPMMYGMVVVIFCLETKKLNS